MENNIMVLNTFSRENAICVAKALSSLNENETDRLLASIIHKLEKISMKNERFDVSDVPIEEIASCLRIISKRIQYESRTSNAWKFYLYGRYDSRQEYILKELREKEKRDNRQKVLARKNVPEILRFLYVNGASRHGVIARNVGMNPGNLSKLMELLSEEDLVIRNKVAKSSFTIYELTRDGYQIFTDYYRQKELIEKDRWKYQFEKIKLPQKNSFMILKEEDYSTDIKKLEELNEDENMYIFRNEKSIKGKRMEGIEDRPIRRTVKFSTLGTDSVSWSDYEKIMFEGGDSNV